jgi:hypothetical protein
MLLSQQFKHRILKFLVMSNNAAHPHPTPVKRATGWTSPIWYGRGTGRDSQPSRSTPPINGITLLQRIAASIEWQ